MKKIVFMAVAAILSISAQAQNMFDYYGLTTPSINGTARYMAMGGSFGALGGDASAIADNPAVLGIFRSNELSFSLNVNPIHTRSAWNTYSIGSDKTKVIANNLTWVLNFPTYRERGFIHSNLSFSFKIREIILIIITPIQAPKVLSIKSVISGNPIVKIY